MHHDDLLELFSGLDLEQGNFVGQICGVSARSLAVTGCGITLYWDGQHRGSLGSTLGVAERGEELQFSLGEGPAVDAATRRVPVDAPELAVDSRWIAFAGQADKAGIAAAFSVPLGAGGAAIGALTAYASEAGPLTAGQHGDLTDVADIVTRLVLALQAGATAGALAAELADVGTYHPEVHQATGMVAVQLGVTMPQAMVQMRARAYAEDQTLAEFSSHVIARRVRMDPE